MKSDTGKPRVISFCRQAHLISLSKTRAFTGNTRTRLSTGVTDMDIILVIGGIALFALTFAYTKICNDI